MARSLASAGEWLPPARSALVLVLDGVGALQLRERAGHARFLAEAVRPAAARARTTFPSTTAAALTSLLTGTDPGTHGIFGYRTLVPETGAVVNQLRGWEEGLLPAGWQQALGVLTARAARAEPSFVVSKDEYAHTGFSEATTGTASFVGVADLDERIDRGATLARSTPGSLVYLYVPELDALGHRHGIDSERWITMLERVDSAVARLSRHAGGEIGVLVTADHGMVDVAAHQQIVIHPGDPRWTGVAHVAGEPRMLHLYADHPDNAAAVYERWTQSESERAWVFTREDAIRRGLFGVVSPHLTPRIGDVLVAARSRVAYYDGREKDTSPQRMVGQHGSLTLDETLVPLVRLGAYAR